MGVEELDLLQELVSRLQKSLLVRGNHLIVSLFDCLLFLLKEIRFLLNYQFVLLNALLELNILLVSLLLHSLDLGDALLKALT